LHFSRHKKSCVEVSLTRELALPRPISCCVLKVRVFNMLHNLLQVSIAVFEIDNVLLMWSLLPIYMCTYVLACMMWLIKIIEQVFLISNTTYFWDYIHIVMHLRDIRGLHTVDNKKC
jgi:hypothetical protein